MKARLPITLGVLMAVSIAVQANQRTGGDDAYYIDTRAPVTNNVVIEWADTKAKGGDAYVKPIQVKPNARTYYVAPVKRGGDN